MPGLPAGLLPGQQLLAPPLPRPAQAGRSAPLPDRPHRYGGKGSIMPCDQHHPPTTRLRRLLTIPTYTAKLWWQGLIVPVGRGPVQRPAPALPPPYSAPAVETPGFTPQYSYTNRYNKILCLFFTFTLHTIQVNIKPNQGRIGSYHSLSTVRERISKSLQEESFCEKSFSVPSGWECTQIKLLYRTLSVAELWLSLLSLNLLHNPAPPPLMFINT